MSSCFLPSPETEPRPLRRIVFMADYSEHAQRALNPPCIWPKQKMRKLYTIRVYTTFDEARAAISAENNDGPLRAERSKKKKRRSKNLF